MKIAIPFDNGNVNQHFGRSTEFKVYEIENGEIKDFKMLPMEGRGHGEIAKYLGELKIDVIICGGLGSRAVELLKEGGIEIYSRVTGDVDQALLRFLRGDIEKIDTPTHECHGH